MSALAAGISAGETVAIWAMLALDAARKAAAVALAWVASTAGAVAAWVVTAAGVVGTWLVMAGKAVLHAAAVALSWVGSTAGVVLEWAITTGAVIAGWVAMAAGAMANALKMAASWLVAMGPVGWVIGGIALLVGAFVWLYATQQWFRDGVDWMWQGICNVFAAAWNNVIAPVLRFLIDGFANVMVTFGDMLVTLGKVPGFEWAADAGAKILDAAKKVGGFSQAIKDIPPTASVDINVTTNYSAVTAQILGAARAGLKLSIMPAAEGVTVLPTPGGTLLRVGEAGRAESVVDTGKMNALLDRALGTGAPGSPNAPAPTFQIYETVSAEATAMQVMRIQNQMMAT